MTTTNSVIRPLAYCIFRHKGSILVSESFDEEKQRKHYRPLGGGMTFGEYSWEAVRREIKKEIGEEIKNLSFLGPTENISRKAQGKHHEIIFMFEGEFVNRSVYRKRELIGHYNNGQTLRAVWKPLHDFTSKKALLYPAGLLEFLTSYDESSLIDL